MAQNGYWRRFSAHALLLSVSLGLAPNAASAAGVKDALSSIDTGPYADAACRAGIEALVGTVDGLGAAQLSNLTLDGNVISGDLTLPIGGSWKLHLFAPNCEKKAFALLRPASDLKLSDMVSSVSGLAEVDKLGLSNQAFVLSNTEGEMASGDVPTSVATILTAASGGDGNFNVTVKPGLTVLGLMDLSKSTLTSKALSFIGFKGSDSKKVVVSGLLGQSMLAAMVSGTKPKPDFSLTGAFPGLSLSLPGGYTLPTAALGFSTTINADGKAFNMQVAVESEWKSALGIPGLNLANVAIDINAGDDTSASLSAATTIGGQALNVSWSAAKADTTEVVVRLAAPAGKSFKIGSLAGLSSVPLINELAFSELTASNVGFGGRLVWKNKTFDAAVAFIGTGSSKKPVVMLRTDSFQLSDLSSDIGKSPIGKIKLPGVIFTLAKEDPGKLDLDKLPAVAQGVLGGMAEKTGGKLDVTRGMGLLATIDASELGDAGKALGISSGQFVLGGTLEGITTTRPVVSLYAAMPTFNTSKLPKFMRVVSGVTPQLVLAFKKTDTSIESSIGVELRTGLKIGSQEVELGTAMRAVSAASGVGINIGGSLDTWKSAFGLSNFDMTDVAVSIGVDADSSVSVGIQGNVALKDGKTTFNVRTLMSPSAAAAGLPKEVVFDLTTNHISLEGVMDLADVFLGSTGDNPLAKAARGKGLFKTLQFDKLPKLEYVQYKNADGQMEDVRIYLATPGASDPNLDINGMGIGIRGRLKALGKELAQANADLSESGFKMAGEVLLDKLGPLKIKEAKLDAAASLTELPHLYLGANIALLGVSKKIQIQLDSTKMAFQLIDKLGQAFTSDIRAEAGISANPDFKVKLAFQGDFLDFVLGKIEKELTKAVDAYKKDVEKARKELKKAEDDVEGERKKVKAAFDKAEKDVDKAGNDIDKAAAKVEKIQKEIKSTKDTIDDKVRELKKVDFWRVDKQIKLALEIAGLNIKLGGMFAAKGTALAALEAVKGSLKLVPVLFQPAILASNAAFEAAKGAVKVADLTVKATEYALKGIEEAVSAYRKSFKFEEALFDGSLQALLGNSPITMKAKFEAFNQPANFDLKFTPSKPEDLGEAIGGVVGSLAKKAISSIKNGFFGGGSSKGGSSSGGSSSSSGGSSFTPPDRSKSGAIDASIPLKGGKYMNLGNNKCLRLKNGKVEFNSCGGVGDDILLRFSPDGDLVSVGSDAKSPLCLEAKGPELESEVTFARCSGLPLQKWRYADGVLSSAAGNCVDQSKNKMVLAECNTSAKSQLWEVTPLADLAKLSETPQTSLYTVSFRADGGKTCLDGADGMLLEYRCDGGDYQVFDLRGTGELRNEFDCVTAQELRTGSPLHVRKCDQPTNQKFEWVGSRLKVVAKGKDLCVARASKSGPMGIKPAVLASCKEESAVWQLQPTNIDAKGRILPAAAMIRLGADRCIEVRGKLQVDGITEPAAILWSCNGDFNQGFSFRWNGEIRSLGNCLRATADKAGARVLVEECVERPNALDPAAFLKMAGTKRAALDKQRWRMNSSGQLNKRGTNLCLSADPKGMVQMRFDPKHLLKPGANKPQTGKVGDIGSMLTVETCSSSKLQIWIAAETLPDGSIFSGYKQIGHTTGGVKRCLETSGDTEYRNVVSRQCKDDTYQNFALAPNGEIRQMGRCLTTTKRDKSFGDGFQLSLAECTNDSEQKWAFGKDGRITQQIAANPEAAMMMQAKLASNASFAAVAASFKRPKPEKTDDNLSTMCISEGPIFNPASKFVFMPPEMRKKLNTVASFAQVGVESCPVVLQNEKSKKCAKVTSSGLLIEDTCNASNALAQDQAFGVSNDQLMYRSWEDDGYEIKKVWIDAAVDIEVASVKATQDLTRAKGNVGKAIQTMASEYAAARWQWIESQRQFRYNNSSKQCLGEPTGKGRLTTATIDKYQKRLAAIPAETGKLSADLARYIATKSKSQIDSTQKKIDALKKENDDIFKKIRAHNLSYQMSVATCTSSSGQKWRQVPVGTTVWQVM